MTRALLSIACHEYGTAAVVYLIYLMRQWKPLPLIGRTLIASGLLLHAVALGGLVFEQGGLPVGMAQGFNTLSFLLLAIFLFLDVQYQRPVLGAFLTPAAVAVLIPGLLLGSPEPALSASVRQPLLPLHVTIALLGIAAFGVAAAVAAVYLLMEWQCKSKRFGILFTRLPPLGFLDELNRRLVIGGFIALSVTLVTGAFFASGAGGIFWKWEPKEVATLVAWAVFAAVLNARFFAGWQGKRVAMLTMAGFCILLVSFFTAFGAQHALGAIH